MIVVGAEIVYVTVCRTPACAGPMDVWRLGDRTIALCQQCGAVGGWTAAHEVWLMHARLDLGGWPIYGPDQKHRNIHTH